MHNIHSIQSRAGTYHFNMTLGMVGGGVGNPQIK